MPVIDIYKSLPYHSAVNTWETAIDAVNRCLRAGVGEFVICAGARNAALIEALAHAEAAGCARLWRHFEERSAGFFALGRTMDTGLPCAVVTTSGTAVAELLPAVIEAFYQNRPLVALTADRPAAFRGSGAPQCIEQPAIFGVYAFQGPLPEWNGKTPIHLNIELDEIFTPNPSLNVSPETFTGEHIARQESGFSIQNVGVFVPEKDRLDVAALARWLREDHYRGFAVMVGGLEPDEREEVYHFCRDFGAPLVAEATSGLREALQGLAIHDADRVLKSRPPGKILRLGEVPSGRFWRDLENLPDVSVWSICRNGLPGLARESQVTRGSLARVIKALGDVDPAEDALDLRVGASARAARIEEMLETYPDSEPALIRALSHYASIGGGVFLGNSLPIREWNLFAQWARPLTSVRANRGANGIDGQLSTWLGSTADAADTWAVIGDLTALYDLSAPFIMDQLLPASRTLAVINNGGGGIFERLPQLKSMSPRAAAFLSNRHQADLSGFAMLWGLRHLPIRTADDLDAYAASGGPLLLEIIPDPRQTRSFWADWDQILMDVRARKP